MPRTTPSHNAPKHIRMATPETAYPQAVGFDLSRQPQSDQDAERIAELLASASWVTTLNLSECELTSTGVATICAALQENTTLEALDLSANECEGAGDAIAAMLHANRTLKALSLDECWLNEESIAKICNALDDNHVLEGLNLRGNYLGNMHALAATLTRNTTLTSLTVGHLYDPPAKEFRELCAALAQNSTLQRLVLTHTSLDDGQSSCLAEALGKNSTLQELVMESVYVGEAGPGLSHRVSKGLARNLGLRSLTVSVCGLTTQDWSILAEMLEHTTNRLERLQLLDVHQVFTWSEPETRRCPQRLLDAISTNRRLIDFEQTGACLLTNEDLAVIEQVTSDNAARRFLSVHAGSAVGSLVRESGHMLPPELDRLIGEAFGKVSNADTVCNVIVAGWRPPQD